MSNKKYEKLSDIDKRLRKLFPTEMWSDNEIICSIEMIGGFEFFNSRSYHNYENWSSGYKITTGERYGKIVVIEEDLDDAITKLEKKMLEFKNIIHTPFSEEQVKNLNEYQKIEFVHPYTCENNHTESRILIATENGWICPTCKYTQNWCHGNSLDVDKIKNHFEL